MEPNFLPMADLSGCMVRFTSNERDLITQAAEHVQDLLKNGDETGASSRLFPPAYGDDFTRQVEFDRLMHSELSESHLAALEILLHLIAAEEVSADELVGVMRALNQIRLVFAKPLDLTDETDDEDFTPNNPLYETYMVYRYFGELQHQALVTLSILTGPMGNDDDDDPDGDLDGDPTHN